ncbi:MAG: biotin--[acetyl-CoA-carboxylase] ligase [Candidatus Andeanibacterium colombiense]|uniref:biotin--[biotin carboxyl-carrier protein] ligase n=1 Tax=Candidatus Andeanibacterium colombiense TaxID=3121345 RepID=A0AAJ5X799_9SPHN|nr:MAG: biotin--[acetyl-CoA-carboxylase] ligase [Sphingomonadaceae bacterium]
MSKIETLAETGSTNADLIARLRNGEAIAEGHWLLADRQSAGRGRQGREWSSVLGNFMGSTVVRLTGREPAPATLALVAGLAAFETVFTRMLLPAAIELKWPNDLLLGGGKIAGILLEREGDAVVVGIGVNLAKAPMLAGAKTVSLGQFGPAPDRDAFAIDLARNFAEEVERWRNFGLDPVLARWCAAAHPHGTPLNVSNGGTGRLEGAFAGLAPDGGLKLQLGDGRIVVVHAGDVSLGGGVV